MPEIFLALTVFEVDMRREYVRPKEKHFKALIHACGKVGYTKKAFALWRQYKKRQLRHNYGIYSDLFNACANSPYPEDALRLTKYLRKYLVNERVSFKDLF